MINGFFNDNDQLFREEITELGGTLLTNFYVYDANGSVTARTNATTSAGATTLYAYNLANKLSTKSPPPCQDVWLSMNQP